MSPATRPAPGVGPSAPGKRSVPGAVPGGTEETFDQFFSRVVRRAPILVGVLIAFFIIRAAGVRAGPVILFASSALLLPLSLLRPELGVHALVINFVNEFDTYYRLAGWFPISLPLLYDFAIAGGILLTLLGPRRRPRVAVAQVWLLALYVLLVVVSVFMSDIDQPNLWETFRTRFLIRPIFFLFLVLVITDRRQLYRLLAVFVVAHTLLMLSSMSDYLQKGLVLYRVRGTLSAINYLSYVCIATTPILIALYAYLRDRVARTAVLALAFLTLFVSLQTLSRSGYYSLIVTLAFLAIRFLQSPRTLAMSLVFLAVFYLLVPATLTRRLEEVESLSTSSRFYLSRIAWRMAVDNPVFGVGAHAYDDMFPHYDYEGIYNKKKAPHNLYLAIAASSGFPALAAYLTLYGVTFWQLLGIDRRHRRRGDTKSFEFFLAVGTQTAMIGHFVFGLAGSYGNSYYAYLLLALSVILIRLEQRAPARLRAR